MSNIVHYYFLAPTWHNHPQTGTLQLGNDITSLQTPEQPVYRGHIPPRQSLESPPEPGADVVSHSWQMSYGFSTESSKTTKLGLWTKFLSVLGLGLDAAVELGKSNTQHYTFERLETTKRSFYVVTGIKAVMGATAHSSAEAGRKATLGVEVDASALGGAPVSVGPEVGSEARNTGGTSWGGASDFVFAYRVQKLTVSRSGDPARQDFTNGAMLGKDRQRVEEGIEFGMSALGQDEIVGSGFKFENAGEEGVCAVPLESQSSEAST